MIDMYMVSDDLEKAATRSTGRRKWGRNYYYKLKLEKKIREEFLL